LALIDGSKVEHIIETLKKLEFGSIVITVHDGNITQVETTEKVRFALEKKTARIAK
jgi:hypothetical protein